MPEENNCPKPDCGRPERDHRWSAGKKLSICGNGHSWDAQAIAEQRAKAKAADNFEVRINVREPSTEQIERMKRRIMNDFPYIR